MAGHSVNRKRALVGVVLILLVIGAAIFAVYRERHSFDQSLHRVGIEAMIASFAAGLVAVSATFMAWRQVLEGLGVHLPLKIGARVYFTSQLGKYLPGSIWPAVLQMEAGRDRGANRRTMLSANLVTIAIGCCTGLIVAALLTPLYNDKARSEYWWALLALPLLLGLLHPRALPAVLDRAFRILRRPPLGESVDLRSELLAACWFVVSWLAVGVHVGILVAAVGPGGPSTFLLSIGGMALATSLGILFIPAPAGAGVRDVILVVILGTVLTTGQALAIVVASRVILLACDVVLASVTGATARRWRSSPAPSK